jgi:glycosyltransferase involved in cell wall biosynthesis
VRIRSWTDAAGGCGYYRVRRPFEELARHGHETVIPTNPPQVPFAEDLLGVDVLVAQRVMHEAAFAQWRHRRALAPIVYEIDDDPWSIDIENPPLASYLHPQVGDWAAEFMAGADLVTVSTPRLAEVIAERANVNAVVLPNRIDAAVLDLPRPERAPDRVTVGWTCSTSHLTDLRSVVEPWREFFLGRPDVELHLMGVDYRDELRTPDVRYTGWNRDPMGYYAAIDFDVGLAPLAPLIFNRSKSMIKSLEYSARGIPTIATDMEPYCDFVQDGVTGYLVSSPEEWVKRLGELVDDADMRAEMGAAARKVAERWTIQQWWPAWEAAYASVLR